MFFYDRTERRVYLLGQRIHHGAVGLLMLLIALALVIDDWHDRRHWFRIERLSP